MIGTILFFGKLQDIAGKPQLPAPATAIGHSVQTLLALISDERPELGAALSEDNIRVCINQELLAKGANDRLISEGDEIAFLPPMSGG